MQTIQNPVYYNEQESTMVNMHSGGMPPQPYNMPVQMMPMQPMQPQLTPGAQVAIDVNLAATFGPMLFNLQDPYYLQHKNTPRKLENSIHKWTLGMSIYMLLGVIAGAVCLALGLIQSSPLIAPIVIMVHAYVLYIILSICCSDTRGYIMNTKPVTLYQECYDSMVRSAPCFRFHI